MANSTPSNPNPNPTSPPPTSRSPSPATAPPIPLTPGPRASALLKIFHDALHATLQKCSPTNFAACFPTPATYVPENLDGLHRDFVARLEESCAANFEAIVKKRDVVRALNELDARVAEAGRRREEAEREAKARGVGVEEPVP